MTAREELAAVLAEHEWADGQINMRDRYGDHTVSLSRYAHEGHPTRWMLRLAADDPLSYGYDEVGTHLDPDSLARLLVWLLTGRAPLRDEPLTVNALLASPTLARVIREAKAEAWDEGYKAAFGPDAFSEPVNPYRDQTEETP